MICLPLHWLLVRNPVVDRMAVWADVQSQWVELVSTRQSMHQVELTAMPILPIYWPVQVEVEVMSAKVAVVEVPSRLYPRALLL